MYLCVPFIFAKDMQSISIFKQMTPAIFRCYESDTLNVLITVYKTQLGP